jgi:hypothetical protein
VIAPSERCARSVVPDDRRHPPPPSIVASVSTIRCFPIVRSVGVSRQRAGDRCIPIVEEGTPGPLGGAGPHLPARDGGSAQVPRSTPGADDALSTRYTPRREETATRSVVHRIVSTLPLPYLLLTCLLPPSPPPHTPPPTRPKNRHHKPQPPHAPLPLPPPPPPPLPPPPPHHPPPTPPPPPPTAPQPRYSAAGDEPLHLTPRPSARFPRRRWHYDRQVTKV